MASLESTLAAIPGLGGYLAKGQYNQQQDMGQLQQMGVLAQLQQQMMSAHREAAFRHELESLPPDQRTPDKLTAIASKFAPAKDLLHYQSSMATAKEAAAERRDRAKEAIDFRYDQLLLHTANEDQKRILEQRRITDKAEQDRRHDITLRMIGGATQEMRQTGLDIQQQRVDLQRSALEQKQGDEVKKRVSSLQSNLEKANLPEADAVLGAVESRLAKRPDLAEYISGPKSIMPDWSVPDDVKFGRQEFSKLFNITLKNRSGAAVTSQELERLKQEFAAGAFKTPQQLGDAVRQARDIIKKHYTSVAAGSGKDVLEAYNQNVRSLGGKIILDTGDQALGAPAAAGIPKVVNFSDLK